MFSIGQIRREEKKAVPKRKQTNKQQQKKTNKLSHLRLLFPLLHANRVHKEIGDVGT